MTIDGSIIRMWDYVASFGVKTFQLPDTGLCLGVVDNCCRINVSKINPTAWNVSHSIVIVAC